MEIRQNWFQLTALQVGFLICLPAILLGSYLSQIYGYMSVIGGVFIAGAALFIYALLQYRVCQAYPGLSTVDIAKHYFSTTGFMFSSAGFSFSLCGWFVIQLNMMARAICSVYPSLSSVTVSCILGFLMTIMAMRGIKILESFANIVFFPMCILLVYTLWVMPAQTLCCSAGNISFACIISLI